MPPNSANDTDAAIVAELTQCQPAISLYVRGLMPGDRDADEVVQATNAKIWLKRDDFELGTDFRRWAFAIARFEVLNYRKQKARDARMHFSDELEETIAEEMVTLSDDLAERHVALKQCLSELKPESRILLMSRYDSQESLADFAVRVGRSVGGIKVTLSRLRSTLLGCIERRLRREGGLA